MASIIRCDGSRMTSAQPAYALLVSTSGDDLVQVMRMRGISRNQVSRPCVEDDGCGQTILQRSIEGDRRYLWLDTTYLD